MKKLLFIAMLVTSSAFAQTHGGLRANDKDIFNVFVVVDPWASYDDGLNIGAGVEYVGSIPAFHIPIYISAQYRTMPVLEGGYNEVVGKIGLPYVSGYDGEWQYRIGIELGYARRLVTAPQFGAEVQLHRKLWDTGISLFGRAGGQTREDQEQFNYDSKWQWKVDVGVSYQFN